MSLTRMFLIAALVLGAFWLGADTSTLMLAGAALSTEIPVAFAQKFRGDFLLLSQQRDSRLMKWVRDDPDFLEAKYGYFDRIGATTVNEVTTRHADTTLVNSAHSRRRIGLRDFDWADLIDKRDMRRFLAAGSLPDKYKMNATMAFKRKQDELILNASRGNAYSIDEDDAATTVALPSAQKVAINGTNGLTLAKLLSAKEILDSANVDPDEPRVIVPSAAQITNLLNTTEVKSKEYNAVQALVEGKIARFLGFDFEPTELAPISSTTRYVMCWAKSGMGIAKGQEINTDVGPRKDKRNSIQVYVDMSMDATRIEDAKVVEIACYEA